MSKPPGVKHRGQRRAAIVSAYIIELGRNSYPYARACHRVRWGPAARRPREAHRGVRSRRHL